ncbi:MAG: hypothetical protein ACRCYZ_04930 [Alphaproteobacteria bacterium]
MRFFYEKKIFVFTGFTSFFCLRRWHYASELRFDKDLETPFGLTQAFLEEKISPLSFGWIASKQPGENSVYTPEQLQLMNQAEDKLNTFFRKDKIYTCGEVMTAMCNFVPTVQAAELDLSFGMIRKLRHLKDTLHVGGNAWQMSNALGDFFAPELISRLMSGMREGKLGITKSPKELESLSKWLSMGYYEISQTYGNLLSNRYKTVNRDNILEIQKHHFPSLNSTITQNLDRVSLGLQLDMGELALKKLKLLQKAVKVDPNNLQAKYRLIEMLFHDPYAEILLGAGKVAFVDLRRHVSKSTRNALQNFKISSEHKAGVKKLIEGYERETGSSYVTQSKKTKTLEEARKKLSS